MKAALLFLGLLSCACAHDRRPVVVRDPCLCAANDCPSGLAVCAANGEVACIGDPDGDEP